MGPQITTTTSKKIPRPAIYGSMISLTAHARNSISPHMKLFPEFGSCWGGAVISPAAEPQTEEHVVRNRKLVKVRSSRGAATYWKPKLNAISENSPLTEVNSGGGSVRPTGIATKKTVKVKRKSPAKAAPALGRAEDYNYWWVILIISPPFF